MLTQCLLLSDVVVNSQILGFLLFFPLLGLHALLSFKDELLLWTQGENQDSVRF
jgi:hypothetical protein